MLNYSDSDVVVKNIAVFYADKLSDPIAKDFFSGKKSLSSTEDALAMAKAFWLITDLASDDHLNSVPVLDNADLEYGMHKLFNKVYGYYEKHGFKEQWKMIADENS